MCVGERQGEHYRVQCQINRTHWSTCLKSCNPASLSESFYCT